MVNFILNVVTFPDEWVARRVVKDCFSARHGSKDEDRAIDFERLRPTPAALLSGPAADGKARRSYAAYCMAKRLDPGAWYWHEVCDLRRFYRSMRLAKTTNLGSQDWAELLFVKVPELYDLRLAEKLEQNVREFGVPDPAEWRFRNWGTSWNAFSSRMEGETVSFLTSERAPIPIYEEISKHFPGIRFSVRAADMSGEYTLCRHEFAMGEMCEKLKPNREESATLWQADLPPFSAWKFRETLKLYEGPERQGP